MIYERQQRRDLRLISAYLDGVISTSQKEKLEVRLIHESELHQIFENLRRTRSALANLPRVKSPRNFTLTPDMVKVRQPKRSPFVNTLRLATSFAAILLVALFGFEQLAGSIPMSAQTTADAPEMASYKMVADATPHPLILWGGWEGAYGSGKGGSAEAQFSMTGDSLMTEESFAEPESFPVEANEESLPGSDLPAAEMEFAHDEDSLRMLSVEEYMPDGDLILGINAAQAGEIISQSPSVIQAEDTGLARINLLRWVQIALGAVVLTGIITLITLQSRRTVRSRFS